MAPNFWHVRYILRNILVAWRKFHSAKCILEKPKRAVENQPLKNAQRHNPNSDLWRVSYPPKISKTNLFPVYIPLPCVSAAIVIFLWCPTCRMESNSFKMLSDQQAARLLHLCCAPHLYSEYCDEKWVYTSVVILQLVLKTETTLKKNEGYHYWYPINRLYHGGGLRGLNWKK